MTFTHALINATDTIGSLAAVLTTAAFMPQLIHTFRTRDVAGISLGMYSVLTSGVALWLLYGCLLGAWPIILANAVTLGFSSTILVMKLMYRK